MFHHQIFRFTVYEMYLTYFWYLCFIFLQVNAVWYTIIFTAVLFLYDSVRVCDSNSGFVCTLCLHLPFKPCGINLLLAFSSFIRRSLRGRSWRKRASITNRRHPIYCRSPTAHSIWKRCVCVCVCVCYDCACAMIVFVYPRSYQAGDYTARDCLCRSCQSANIIG